MASVGLCVVTTSKRGYPLEDSTHMALRESHTLRVNVPPIIPDFCVCFVTS